MSHQREQLVPVRYRRPSGVGATIRSHTTLREFTTARIEPDGFETEAEVIEEDRLRAHHMRRVVGRPGNILSDSLWLGGQRLPRCRPAPLDRDALNNLADRLEGRAAPPTLASAHWMRSIRLGFYQALLKVFAAYPDEELRTATVLYKRWVFTPADLDTVTAKELKLQFQQHLHRAGVLQMPGPLIAVLHGEFEPSSGHHTLHYHLVTTRAKATALKVGLTKRIRGYTATATGSPPIRCSQVRDRERQFSYLLKSFWPSRPVIRLTCGPKRVRDPRRIPEPLASQLSLWLDRQPLRDLVLMNDTWSRRNGGTRAGRQLCLFVTRAGRSRAVGGRGDAVGGHEDGVEGRIGRGGGDNTAWGSQAN